MGQPLEQHQEQHACGVSSTDVEDWGRVETTNKCYGATTCRVLAPEIFREVKAKSKPAFNGNFTEVGKAIESREEFDAVRRAIVSCPGKAIRWVEQPKVSQVGLPSVFDVYPELIEDDVYYMGFSDKTTFGCAGFFIHRGEGRNILIDPPIAHPKLVDAVNRMGGVQHLLFTHVDHTGNQEAWHTATKARRLMHTADVVHVKNEYSPFPVTKDFETLLELQPLETTTLEGTSDFRIVSTPGHTVGSLCFVYKDRFLFTGDSLANSRAIGHLICFRIQCWQDWATQIISMNELQAYTFQWVLAGHGEWRRFDTADEARSDLQRCLSWMQHRSMAA
ncbi:unnamed protein product [Polarella glacialis]|uniref:Metallo-beta-lactamase domain-containing protein n=1 Tax=Polarella glacialis TaxID=89957 RepID=A0A813L256_POLGL|nr:unnamed protein product [Polarella glacialis]